eukprot:846108-Pleurochrysis_carterae.AAC.1
MDVELLVYPQWINSPNKRTEGCNIRKSQGKNRRRPLSTLHKLRCNLPGKIDGFYLCEVFSNSIDSQAPGAKPLYIRIRPGTCQAFTARASLLWAAQQEGTFALQTTVTHQLLVSHLELIEHVVCQTHATALSRAAVALRHATWQTMYTNAKVYLLVYAWLILIQHR